MYMSSSILYLTCSKEGHDLIHSFLGMTVRFMAEAVVLLRHNFHLESG